MGLLGSIAGGALGAIGSIFGGSSASKAMKNVKSNLQHQKQQNQTWFDRVYNEDVTQRADVQRMLTKTEDMIRNRNKQAAGMQAVMGGTEESVAATKAAGNQALSEVVSQVSANAIERKDALERRYQDNDARLDDALNNLEINKAQGVKGAVQGVSAAAGGLAGAF